MNSEEVLECAVCCQQVENVLGLGCRHNLCLECTVKQLDRLEGLEGDIVLECALCHSPTTLEAKTLEALRDLFHEQPSVQCTMHTHEQKTLFCFDCQCECMCVECFMTGPHKSHEVKNEIAREIAHELGTRQEGVGEKIEGVARKRRLVEQQVEAIKAEVQQHFFVLQQTMAAKQAQLLQQCDQIGREKNEVIDQEARVLEEYAGRLREEQGQLHQLILKADTQEQQIRGFNYYASSKDSLAALLDHTEQQKQTPSIGTPLGLEVGNMSTLQRTLAGFRLEVAAVGLNQSLVEEREGYEANRKVVLDRMEGYEANRKVVLDRMRQ